MKKIFIFAFILIACFGCDAVQNIKTDLIVDIVSVDNDQSIKAIPAVVFTERIYAVECRKVVKDIEINRTLLIPGELLIPYTDKIQLPVELELCIPEKRIRYYLGGVVVFDGQAEEVFVERVVEALIKLLKK